MSKHSEIIVTIWKMYEQHLVQGWEKKEMSQNKAN